MSTERTGPGTGRWRRPLALVGLVTLVVAACGGSTTASPSAAAPSASAAGATASAAGGSAAPAASDAGYTGPEATISYSIWGDPQEIKAQQAIVDAFHEANPKITVKVTVSDWEPYWDKLQTSIAGGDAPDVFAMDGPLFPDYQTRDVLLDLKPFIDRDGYDLGQLADQAVADFTTPDGQFGLPRDLNVVALYYNKAMFDAAGIPYPDDTWDWAKLTDVAKKLTLKDAIRKDDPVGLLHRVDRHGELLVRGRLAERRRHHLARPQDEPRRERPGGGRDPVPAGPDLEGQGHARRGHHRRARRRLRAGPGGDGVQRIVARRDPSGRRASTSGSPRCRRVRPDRPPRSTRPARSSTRGRRTPTPPGQFVKYLASPAAQTKIMDLKASMPANKEVLNGPFATSFDGAQGPRRRHRLRPDQAVVQGLQRVDDRAPDGARHQRLHRCRTRRPSRP